MIILALAGACPEALSARDAAGGTLLHRVCALPHVPPGAARHALEHVRGVSGPLRAPEAVAHVNRAEHCAVGPPSLPYKVDTSRPSLPY